MVKNNKKKIVVAISGGVDSSVAAFLLQKEGDEVIGIFLRLISGSDVAESQARRVCQRLGIRFYPVNLKAKFKKEVVDYFLDSYALGLTPNPCVKCNRFIKFGELLKIARGLGANYIATGHYVRNREITNPKSQTKSFKLYRGKDEKKDQSYFLYNLNQEILKQVLFPLGDYKKIDIKKIADKNKLPYLEKESQDICFLPPRQAQDKQGEHNDFLKEHLKLKKGKIKLALSLSLPRLRTAGEGADSPAGGEAGGGEIIGEHQGLPLYTIGQRRGVEIGGTGPYWVVDCDYKNNILYVTNKKQDPALFSDELVVQDVNWVAGVEPKMPLNCLAVIRYGHEGVEAQGSALRVQKGQGSALSVRLKKPQRAVTPGQSAVLYNKDEVLGGGIITH